VNSTYIRKQCFCKGLQSFGTNISSGKKQSHNGEALLDAASSVVRVCIVDVVVVVGYGQITLLYHDKWSRRLAFKCTVRPEEKDCENRRLFLLPQDLRFCCLSKKSSKVNLALLRVH
jgi:hypothetical protein